MSRMRLRENFDAYVLIGPWLIGFLLLTAGPMLGSVVLALSDWDLLNAPKFIGLKNFPELWRDDLFWLSLYNTAYYTFISVPLHLIVALAAALILNLKLRWINYYRTMVYLPSITPSVASAFLWSSSASSSVLRAAPDAAACAAGVVASRSRSVRPSSW